MSGGSMDYLSYKVADASFYETTALRRAFRAHLRKVDEALHSIEWVDSGDSSHGSEDAAIRACLGPGAALAQTIADAQKAYQELGAEISRAQTVGAQP